MKTLMTVLMAGAMLGSAGFARANDAMAEERFKAKYGRYTPAEELRRRQAAEAKRKDGGHESCCRRSESAQHRETAGRPMDSGAEERFKAKWGRNTVAEETRLAEVARRRNAVLEQQESSADPQLAAAAQVCDQNCCGRNH